MMLIEKPFFFHLDSAYKKTSEILKVKHKLQEIVPSAWTKSVKTEFDVLQTFYFIKISLYFYFFSQSLLCICCLSTVCFSCVLWIIVGIVSKFDKLLASLRQGCAVAVLRDSDTRGTKQVTAFHKVSFMNFLMMGPTLLLYPFFTPSSIGHNAGFVML